MWSWPLSSDDAAAEHRPVADDRLERRRLPQLERVDGLDVVVAVDEGRRRAGARGASRRRRSDGRRSPRPRRARARSAAGPPRSTRPSRRQSSACSGSAEMLGMRRNARYDSRRSSAWPSSQASTAGSMAAVSVDVMAAMVSGRRRSGRAWPPDGRAGRNRRPRAVGPGSGLASGPAIRPGPGSARAGRPASAGSARRPPAASRGSAPSAAGRRRAPRSPRSRRSPRRRASPPGRSAGRGG